MKQIVSIQYLRAIAALAVVYHHAFENHLGSALRPYAFGIWGVDIFFVISGFIMWVTTANSSTTATLFWRKRVIRIYPIYWVALSIWIICRFIAPDRLANVDVTAKTTILSYLLIPHHHLAFPNHIWPILIPGWTLQYELFFYLIFGLALSVVSRPLRAASVLGCLCFLTVVGYIIEPANALLTTYTDPLLLEFGGGVILGIIYLRGGRLPPWLALVMIFIAIPGLVIDEYLFSESRRFLFLGIPAAMVVWGTASLEPALVKRPNAPMVLLGDASYALYLFHPIAMGLVAAVWARLSNNSHPASFACVAIGASILSSILVHAYIERPLTRWLAEARVKVPAQISA
jgi:exopolysaccharide production protein ExoZ